MTSHVGRLYAVALALVVFFLTWAVVAARPWAAAAPDPRLRALKVREAQLRQEARLVNRLVAQRKSQLASAPAAPAVRVVNLPPITITRSS
jgi:hypothetical protein